jgi:hypothetical protein
MLKHMHAYRHWATDLSSIVKEPDAWAQIGSIGILIGYTASLGMSVSPIALHFCPRSITAVRLEQADPLSNSRRQFRDPNNDRHTWNRGSELYPPMLIRDTLLNEQTSGCCGSSMVSQVSKADCCQVRYRSTLANMIKGKRASSLHAAYFAKNKSSI